MAQTVFQTASPNPVVDYAPTKQYPSFSGIINQKTTVTALTTAGAVTFSAAQILGGIITWDPGGGETGTLDTAANIIAAIEGADVGSTIRFLIRNTADGAETITVAVGTGGTAASTDDVLTIAQYYQKEFLLRVTAVGLTPTYDLYTMGSADFHA